MNSKQILYKIFFFLFLGHIVLYAGYKEPVHTQYGDSSAWEQSEGIAFGKDDFVYTVGYTDYNVGNFTNDILIGKHYKNGDLNKTLQYSSAGESHDYGLAIATDDDGYVYIAGTTKGILPSNDLSHTNTYEGGFDVFVSKFDSNLTHIWTHQYGGTADEYAYGIVIDQGVIYVTGHTTSDLNSETNSGSFDIFLLELNDSYTPIKTTLFGSEYSDKATSIAVDTQHNIYISGYSRGSFDANNNCIMAGNTTEDDALLIKVDNTNTQTSCYQFGTSSDDYLRGIAFDTQNNLYLAGDTKGALVANEHQGDADIYLRKISNDLQNVLWTTQQGSDASDLGSSVVFDGSNNIMVVGDTLGTIVGDNVTGTGCNYLATYNDNGDINTTKQYGLASGANVFKVIMDDNNDMFVTGYTEGDLNNPSDTTTDKDYFMTYFEVEPCLAGQTYAQGTTYCIDRTTTAFQPYLPALRDGSDRLVQGTDASYTPATEDSLDLLPSSCEEYPQGSDQCVAP